ncbi:uncharacterized protein BDR25DRAFT_338695 [Lindgomyces ingoldianus]|uniref:Uncharacterized protein n=1 Tax=Lindgomyces ingoldianus TaxID=673940 RepID=A0ACB6RGZ0_9PLEO|nr:uncharacterized protein BDR25DRAFT_338695 [Lindgomyces ingoldianus]KAF2478000.1 hypothetical protein BDR25DRAFT_338695 [Lindgomyces ingoldianus]
MAAPKRSRSDPPPPITIEDTASGAAPQPSPSPTRLTEQARSYSAYDPRQTQASNLRDRRQSTWGHKRKPSPGIEWHTKWTKDSWRDGRVLLVDYVAREHTEGGRRKIVAQEFSDIDGLRRFYLNQDLSQQAALRVIHVQNASWATRFLLRKFNIDASDDLVGTTFGRWAKYEKPQRRGGKPLLNGKTFRTQRDPWRGISRTAFGLDYLRHYAKHKVANSSSGMKMMELNYFDSSDQPTYGYDVYVQRLSVYVQRSEGPPGLPVDPDIRNPYNEEEYQEYQRLKRQYGSSVDANGHYKDNYIPKLQTLDNGSTIILFEHSQSGSVEDTLIGARQEIEQRWRRLTFYLPKEDASNDATLATECMDFILRDIFKALAFTWEKYLNICETHVSILEDKIYDNPSDESRAPELWTNSSLWLKVERLLYIHSGIIREMRSYLRELAEGEDPRENDLWLGSASDELDKLTTQFQEGVIKPTTSLSDLMYKSVGIRDARHSLQLGLSMWRLSWITFIFLPLTFVCGFFGMNVDTFEPNPSIKWWFITSVPLMLVVIFLWYGVKHTLASQRQDPLRRGVYESLFHTLANDHPTLWGRRGPRPGIVPVGWWSGVKWRLITTWFDPERTIAAKGYDPGDEELGVWSRVKRYLVKRWLGRITVMPLTTTTAATTQMDLESAGITQDLGAVGELLSLATPIALADADPTAASRLQQRIPMERLRSLSPTRSDGRPGSGGRTSGDAGSGVMVEEKGASEDERSGDESDGGERRDRSFMERLNVPLYPGGAGVVAGGL